MLTGAKSSVVEMFAFGDRAIGERRIIGALLICDSWSRRCGDIAVIKGNVLSTADDVSECS